MKICNRCGKESVRTRILKAGKPDEELVCQECLPKSQRSSKSWSPKQGPMFGTFTSEDGKTFPAVGISLDTETEKEEPEVLPFGGTEQ